MRIYTYIYICIYIYIYTYILFYYLLDILRIDCVLIAHAHDVSQGMGQGMPMTWAKTWALLEAALNRGASWAWAINRQSIGNKLGNKLQGLHNWL